MAFSIHRSLLFLVLGSAGCSSPTGSEGTGAGGSASSSTTGTAVTGSTTTTAQTTSSSTTSSGTAGTGGSGGHTGTGGGAPDCSVLPDGTSCATGTCCGGTCRSDYQNDPQNCGVCGRACGSGDCLGVACVGEEVDVTAQEIASLETDDAHVYWTSAGGANPSVGGVKRVNLSSLVVEDVIPNTYLYNGAVPRGSTLFVTDYEESQYGGGLYACPLNNCAGNLTPIGNFTWPYACPHLWTTAANDVLGCAWTGTNVVPFRCTLQGCETLSGADPAKLSVTTDGTRAYFSSYTNGTITAKHLTAGTETTFASGLPNPWQVAAGDDGYLYWHEAGAIKRAALGPQAATILPLVSVLGVRDLRERDGKLYWLTGDGSISACDAASCQATTQVIASSPGSSSLNAMMIVTPDDVYFTEINPGLYRLLRVPR